MNKQTKQKATAHNPTNCRAHIHEYNCAHDTCQHSSCAGTASQSKEGLSQHEARARAARPHQSQHAAQNRSSDGHQQRAGTRTYHVRGRARSEGRPAQWHGGGQVSGGGAHVADGQLGNTQRVGRLPHHGRPHHLTPYHVTPHHVTPKHITSHHTVSHQITVTSHHRTSHHTTSHSNDITSHNITPHHITSHHITPHHITSHHITSHHITSHHITSRTSAGTREPDAQMTMEGMDTTERITITCAGRVRCSPCATPRKSFKKTRRPGIHSHLRGGPTQANASVTHRYPLLCERCGHPPPHTHTHTHTYTQTNKP